MELVKREAYMRWLLSFKDKPLIKVLSGMRRSGKSTCLEMYADYLRGHGVPKRQIVSLNFEEMENEPLLDRHVLHDYLVKHLVKGKTLYIFLDEIQKVDGFEKIVDSLYVKKGVDLYVTGSSADLFSSEIATLLTGRYVELPVLPFSFKEALGLIEGRDHAAKLMSYFTYGALPEAYSFKAGSAQQRQYVESVYNTILAKDILKRNKNGGRILVDSILRYMIDNIGNLTSAKRIADRLTSQGTKVCSNTVQSYLETMTDAGILHKADRYDVVGREHLKLINKYYLNDFAFKYHILGNPTIEVQQLLENAVFLELKRRGLKVATGKVRDKEVDFVVQDGDGEIQYIQVAVTVGSTDKLEQELSAFKSIKDNYRKVIITMDPIFTANHNGVKTINVIDFLLSDNFPIGN